MVDIHLVSNDIAVRNGYHDLEYKVFEGNNPDWIWAGNKLILPDESIYTIRKGDNIWFIASRLIRRDVESKQKRLIAIEEEMNQDSLTFSEESRLLGELREMADTSLSEQFREKLNNKLREVE